MQRRFLVSGILACLLVLLGSACATVKTPAPSATAAAPAAAVEPCAPEEVKVPQTNTEIRIWYNYQVVAISEINKRWIAGGMSVEDRARRAYDMRHEARVNARFMMPNKGEVKMLQKRDQAKYGNPDGPTFSYLVEKNRKKGLEGDQVYEAIIESSSRTSAVYNQKFGVKKDGG